MTWPTMEIVPVENFGVAVEILFPRPLGFTQSRLEEFSGRLCDTQDGLSLRPDQIRLRRTDDLYQYELSAQFFGENGWLVRTADRVKFGVRNGRTVADWNVILQLLQRLYGILRMDPKSTTVLSTHVHGRFHSDADRDAYLQRFAYSSLIARPAGLGFVQIVEWEKEIRVLIEKSHAIPGCVFVSWDTQYDNNQHWETFLGSFLTMMENAVNLFDLSFEPLRETV
jgi:hypothetical protein